jgi:hypothetical protein
MMVEMMFQVNVFAKVSQITHRQATSPNASAKMQDILQ